MKTAIEESTPGQNECLTKRQIAARMKVTTRTIDAWMQKGLIPYRKIGRTVRFMSGEVDERFAGQTRQAQLPVPAAHPGPGIAAMLRERAKTIRSAEARRGHDSPIG